MAAYVTEKGVTFEDRQAILPSGKIPFLRDLSRVRMREGRSDLNSPKTARGTPKTEVIDLQPYFQAVRIVDGCVKRKIDGGGYVWDVQHRNPELLQRLERKCADHRRACSDGVALEKMIAEREARIRELRNLSIPLTEEQVRKLVISVGNREERLCGNRKIYYPALFRVNLGKDVRRCFVEVHSRKDILFLMLDRHNPDAVINNQGSFKTVYRAWHLKKPQLLAYAISKLERSPRSIRNAAEREEKYLSLFSGQTYAVDLRKAFYYQNQQQILVMKCYSESLLDFINKMIEKKVPGSWISDKQKLYIAIRILQAIAYLNNEGVLHRDVKPENFLMHGLEPVITDFGLSCDVDDYKEMDKGSGSPHYVSYEGISALINRGYAVNTPQGDVWSAACILWLLFAERYFPWCDDVTKEKWVLAKEKMERIHKRHKPKKDQKVYAVVWKMWHPDRMRRMTAAGAAHELTSVLKSLPDGHTYKMINQFPFMGKKRYSSRFQKHR